MPRFFIAPVPPGEDTVTLTDENAHHAAYSLRLRTGDRVFLCDQQYDYTCELIAFDGNTVQARILDRSPIGSEPPYTVHLYQALPKGDKLDMVIQKAVECGAAAITPFVSARCIAQVKPEAEARKTERRSRIAAEAAKQCGRGIIPQVHQTIDYAAMLSEVAACDLVLFCYEGSDTIPLPHALVPLASKMDEDPTWMPTIAVIVGSEGGFSPEEAQLAKEKGCCLVGLGHRILRTETASPFVLGCLVYALELAQPLS